MNGTACGQEDCVRAGLREVSAPDHHPVPDIQQLGRAAGVRALQQDGAGPRHGVDPLRQDPAAGDRRAGLRNNRLEEPPLRQDSLNTLASYIAEVSNGW